MIKRKPPTDDKQQSKRFIEKARELGAETDSSTADAVMGRLARTPPTPHSKAKPKKRRAAC